MTQDLPPPPGETYSEPRQTWTSAFGAAVRREPQKPRRTWSEVVWSRDGEWIFFSSFKSGEAELFRILVNDRDPEPLTSDNSTWEYPGGVSTDGQALFFWRTSTSQADLMTLKLEPGVRPQHLTNSPQFSESSPRVSPDGAWLAYTSNETGSVA